MRYFLIKYIFTGLAFVIFLPGFSSKSQENSTITFPEPFAFTIHDLGWMTGNNEGYLKGDSLIGPYRAGVDRVFDVHDYEALVDIAEKAGTRIRGLFVLCELDRLNILKNYPTTNWMGDEWDNSHLVSEKQFEIVEYVKTKAASLEFGLHGVCHGYWTDKGVGMNAEWYNTRDKKPWPEKTIKNHILAMKQILAQYGLTEESGHSYPESFDSGGNSYYWNDDPKSDEYSLGYLLAREGCKYISNSFGSIPREENPPKGKNAGGFDNGVLVICKGGDVPWYQYAGLPETLPDEQDCNMLRLHFPNFLAQDQFLQEALNKEFIEYYRKTQSLATRYVAKNTEQFYSQWLYRKYAEISCLSDNQLIIDNRNMPDEVYKYNFQGNLVLKVKLNDGEHIENAEIDGNHVACYFEDQGYGFIYLPPLEQEVYKVSFKKGTLTQMPHVYNDGTYNVYSFKQGDGRGIEIDVKIYGSQRLRIRNIGEYKTGQISSSNPDLKIETITYSEDNKESILSLNAHDFQGERGIITLSPAK
jgi:hypothetical protein